MDVSGERRVDGAPHGRELVGREAELAATTRFLSLAATGRAALVISGDAGIGKTSVWLHALDAAFGVGMQVLRARPTEAEAGNAFAGLTDLLGPHFDALGPGLPSPLAAALAAALLRAPGGLDDTRAVGAATLAALDIIAATRPVLVAIDDVQWLDPDTTRALAFAAVRTSFAVSWAVTIRSDDPSIVPLDLDRAVDLERCVRIQPGPLSVAGVHRLLRQVAIEVPRVVLTRIAEASGGNPFVALELGRAWSQRRPAVNDLVMPASVRGLVEARLDRLSPGGRDLVLHVAAAGRPTLATLERVVGRESARFLEEAEEAGVLVEEDGRVVAGHPLLAATVYATATQVARRRVHGRLADAASDPEERARHLARAAVAPDPGSSRAVEAGAMAAMSRGAPAAAAELFAEARRLGSGEPATDTHLVASEAMARLATGDVPAARGLAEQALAMAPTTAGRLAVLAQVADVAWADGALERESDRLRAALGQPVPDRALEVDLRSKLVAFGVTSSPLQASEQADAALALVEPSVDPVRAGYLLAHREMARALAGLGIRWDLLAAGVELETRGLDGGGGLSSPPLVMYVMSDRLEEARQRFAVEDAWYAAHGEEGWRAERQGQLSLAELRAGNTSAAVDLADAAAETLERVDATQAWPLVFAWRSLVDAHVGRLDRAVSTIERTIQEQSEAGHLWRAILESVHGFVAHALGDDAATERAIARMRAATDAIGVRDLLADRSESFLVEVCTSKGDHAGAEAAVERLVARHSALPRSWTAVALARGRALLLASSGNLAGAVATLDRTPPEDLRRLPFEHGWTLLARGRMLRRMREKTEAAGTLREARDLFARLGGEPWAERADHELGRVGLRRGSPGRLTATELEIARLAARGLSNREMAQAAFVSPKTIEANLARIYRKLEIRSRAELGAWVAEQAAEGPGQT